MRQRSRDGDGATDTATRTVSVTEPTVPASFQISNLDAPSSATLGDTLTVSATVENTGDKKATKTVEFSFDGSVTDSKDVTLAGGASQRVSFSLDTSGVAPGTYSDSISTEDDSETGRITLEDGTNTLTIIGVDGTTNYGFSVTGTVGEANDTVEQQFADRIDGKTSNGVVGPSVDAYTFADELRSLSVSGGNAETTANGEEVDESEG